MHSAIFGQGSSLLGKIAKGGLRDDRGIPYKDFREKLRPKRVRIVFDIAGGLTALLITGLLGACAISSIPSAWLVIMTLCAIFFGYWMAYLQLFIHEAAHFHLTADRKLNDRIANCLIGLWVGVRVENYRLIHWEHHRHLGSMSDSENSYFSALTFKFLCDTLLGLRALRVIRQRKRRIGVAPVSGRGMLVCALSAHSLVVASLVGAAGWPLGVAWMAGIGMFFPLFGALRQLLEHRSISADRQVDYSLKPHGATTRMFREGLFASTFGAAGFTRHALHHWDPSVSYTNLADVESFLVRCGAAPNLSSEKTTYMRAFLALYGR